MFADVDGHLVERSSLTTVVPLTPREVELMEYLDRGQSHREIAHALHLGVETVRRNSADIRAELGVRSKRELIGLRSHSRVRWPVDADESHIYRRTPPKDYLFQAINNQVDRATARREG